MRRYGEPRRNGQKYQLRPGVYAILPKGRELLLTHQVEPEPEFQLPGGGIDAGEAVLPALHREVMEETGWRISNIRKISAYRRFTFMPEYDMWAEKVCHIYVATPVRPLGLPTEKGHTAIFAPPHTALEVLASASDKAVLRRYLTGQLGPAIRRI